MSGFDSHTLDVLEYPKIISILEGLCLTQYGTAQTKQIAPITDAPEIRIRLDEVSQMKDIIQFGAALPLYRQEDVTEVLERSKTEGYLLEPKELLQVKELIEVSMALHGYAPEERDRFPLIAAYLADMHPYGHIKKAVDKAIDRDGQVLDGASQKLKQIRGDIGSLRRKIVARLDRMLTERRKMPGWQDDTVTQRDGRYVIPFLSGQFRSDAGIVHDRSQSGATLYVEPNETVEMNNQLGLLMQGERLEIDRILRSLTALVGEAADGLLSNGGIIGIIDAIHAAATLSIKTDGNAPVIKGKSCFNMIDCRHPLLLYYTEDNKSVVGNDISLDQGRLAMIITGPNTGGKTVALKTVGLLVLMAQSGLHIPADNKSEIGIFKNILADIGDEQSIELSLSTFSSHIRQIAYAVKNAGPDTLILFDEIGAGTDPKEGAALAEAILVKLTGMKAHVIVTTHYSQLKTLPMVHPEMENASFEFDKKTLQPTYRLHAGIPGASYAVEIAERLGLSKDIADKASELLGKGERSLSKLIESLEAELAVLRKDKGTLEGRLKHAGQLEEYYKSQSEKLKHEIDQAKQEHLKELEQILNESRTETERLVKGIRESQASKESVKKAHKYLQQAENKLKHLKKKHMPQVSQEDDLQPGDTVWVESLKQEGELAEAPKGNEAKVRIGNIMVTVDTKDIKKISDMSDTRTGRSGITSADNTETTGPEIQLLGMTVEEASEALDKFLDSAVLSGLTQLYVVHGKGTGVLRKAMTELLQKHPAVASVRLGNWNEGGSGVTVVKLK